MKTYIRAAASAALVLGTVSCGNVVRDSKSPVLLTVATLSPTPLLSDVVVLRTSPAPCTSTAPCATIIDDTATATISASMKNTLVSPTTNNQITINRYHVEFTRSDGRNMQGVDVPYGFDGAVTVSVAANATADVPFELVRHSAKEERPLVQLVSSSNIIATIATITFYGTDAVGNVVSASGQMSVNFGNFADKQ